LRIIKYVKEVGVVYMKLSYKSELNDKDTSHRKWKHYNWAWYQQLL